MTSSMEPGSLEGEVVVVSAVDVDVTGDLDVDVVRAVDVVVDELKVVELDDSEGAPLVVVCVWPLALA